MNGLTLIQQLSKNEICIPVVVISSETKPAIIHKAMALVVTPPSSSTIR